MACRKCGSGWTTKYGKDRASCPECCKLARCVARKRGLLDAGPQRKPCGHCAETFEATTPSQKAHKRFCSAECQRQAQVLLRRKYQRDVRAGRRATRPLKRREVLECLACGNGLGPSQKKYCSKACFMKARSTGIQSWDRSSIDEASRNRPSNVHKSPWAYIARRASQDLNAFLRKATMLWAASSKTYRDCRVCGRLCLDGGEAYCSAKCRRKVFISSTCPDCKEDYRHRITKYKKRCRRCERRCSRRNRNRLATNHRKRCRKNGVPFDPSIKSKDVFSRDNYVCHICKSQCLQVFTKNGHVVHPRSPTVDHHPYPLSAGVMGHTWDNVRCACFECNWKKGAEWSGQLPLWVDSPDRTQPRPGRPKLQKNAANQ